MDNYINTTKTTEELVDELKENLTHTSASLAKALNAQDSYNQEEDPYEQLKKYLILNKYILEYTSSFNEGSELLTQVTALLVMYLNNKQYDKFKAAKKLAPDLTKISDNYLLLNAIYQTQILQDEIL